MAERGRALDQARRDEAGEPLRDVQETLVRERRGPLAPMTDCHPGGRRGDLACSPAAARGGRRGPARPPARSTTTGRCPRARASRTSTSCSPRSARCWEETCVRPVLGPRLPTVEYISWAACPSGSATGAAFGHRRARRRAEQRDRRGVLAAAGPGPRAAGRATHDDPVISAFRPARDGAADPGRHASAGRKADWPGDDGDAAARRAPGVADARSCWPACWPASPPSRG